ncbi:NADH:flavin oxidoreductase [Stieleria magnilauensis]|uniref:NADH oxidase n=1 Tax=Stieleria magnilauensis TaxID=2527963 RepID=A0ABX5XRY3_9BACT|nr:NADH oxidase [Planctomycetes bacterium TBK1r]
MSRIPTIDLKQATGNMLSLSRPVLSPVEMFGHRIRNRLAVAPMTRVSASGDGFATDRMKDYYREYARGGFAIVITEGVYTDEDASQGYDRQPGIANRRQANSWAPIATAISDHGSLAIMQLMHAGALSQRQEAARIIAPSAVPPLGEMMPAYGGSGPYRLPSAMTKTDLAQVRKGFVTAARRARDAGFHGVEIHAANGYLLDQFITEYTNRRDDEYGGSVSARIRYPAEIVAAVRDTSPDDFVVGVRVSEAKVNDFNYRWGGKSEAETIFVALAEAGASYIHVAGEGRGFRESSSDKREPLSTVARGITGLPVIANGGLYDPDLADDVILDEHADLIALGRAALATPDWPRRIANGERVVAFENEMISPSASIQNTDAWFARKLVHGVPG